MAKTTYVERIARELYNGTRGHADRVPWSKLSPRTRSLWEQLAIAALDLASGARARLAESAIEVDPNG